MLFEGWWILKSSYLSRLSVKSIYWYNCIHQFAVELKYRSCWNIHIYRQEGFNNCASVNIQDRAGMHNSSKETLQKGNGSRKPLITKISRDRNRNEHIYSEEFIISDAVWSLCKCTWQSTISRFYMTLFICFSKVNFRVAREKERVDWVPQDLDLIGILLSYHTKWHNRRVSVGW